MAEDKLFRYLEKYTGTYRVLSRYDEDLEDFPRDENGDIDPSFDELYLKCSKGEVRSSYMTIEGKDVILCWYSDSGERGRNVYKAIKEKYPKIWLEVDDCGTFDYYLYFEEKDLDKVMKFFGPQTSGAKIKWYSDKNLPKPVYEIPESDAAKYDKIMAKLDKTQKMQFSRACCSAFDEELTKKFSTKRKPYDPAQERKETRMKPKVFIHYKGMWNEFLAFAKEFYKETYK